VARNSKIEWCDDTWNPVTGCSVVSPGCTNCYAMRLAGTRMKHHPSRAGLTDDTKAGPVWNGRVTFNEDWLDLPLRWKKPRRIFVAAHGDLFHEAVPDEWIDRVFAVMALAPQHSFQVLTKRAARMRRYIEAEERRYQIELQMYEIGGDYDARTIPDAEWPLPNVWLGFSAEDQARLNERWKHAGPLAEQGWLVWCSAEPLLGPLDFTRVETIPNSHGIYGLTRCGIRVDGDAFAIHVQF